MYHNVFLKKMVNQSNSVWQRSQGVVSNYREIIKVSLFFIGYLILTPFLARLYKVQVELL